MEKYPIILMSGDEFIQLKDLLSKCNVDTDDYTNESVAMAITISSGSHIVVNNDVYSIMDDDERHILIAHEVAHCEGIKSEEDADRRALDYLETDAQHKILIDQWKYRHGHEYKEVT